MLFSSITFLYYFLPVVLFFYFLVPASWKNVVLLLASLFFYGWGEPVFLIWMLAAVCFTFFAGILIEKFQGSKKGKFIFLCSVSANVLYLGIFKYSDFILENVNRFVGISLPLLHLTLPIGISFYTFQLLSYLIDVYRKDGKAKRNLFSFALYIVMFPQLIAGPIVRYSQVEQQLEHRENHITNIGKGMSRFVIGLAKKVLLANSLGELCEIVKSSSDLSVLFLWLYAVSLCLQIYFDFSGYSDMAIGLGTMFGFSFPENFNYPYLGTSITDFWRRWHISLGSWFRDYVYIPLGGNRVRAWRFCVNLFIVWFLTGIWHGAEWNFILWGLYFGFLLWNEKAWLGRFLEKTKVTKHLYVLFFVLIGFVLFDNTNLSQILYWLTGMFGGQNLPVISQECIYYGRSYGILLVVSCVAATPFGKTIGEFIQNTWEDSVLVEILESIFLTALLLLITAYLVDGSYNPFLYFRF